MATEETAAAAAAPGLPQLDFSTFPNQIFWLVLTLVVIYLILTEIALPRIAGALADRHETIAGDLEQAASLKQRAAEAEEAYTKALADARTEAQKIANETRAEIQKEVDAATAKANAEIAARAAESEQRIGEIRDGAMASVETVAIETAEAIVSTLTPGSADQGAIARAVQSAIKG
ncbi:MAG: F0F1 ATP synthase subunit B' [Pseudomonadota bacterium]